MLLDALKDFSWHNEPYNVRFNEEGMVVETTPHTDFWQSAAHRFHKDDGHFFYQPVSERFNLEVQWTAETPQTYDQCGIMLRRDNLNWAKAGILSASLQQPQLGTIVTINGQSDWAVFPLPEFHPDIRYRLRGQNGDFTFSCSFDGETYQRLRMFRLETLPEGSLKAGAYACSPGPQSFTCILNNIELK